MTAPRPEGLTDADLDAIEAQLDSSVPYYVPTLVRMAREALVLRRDAEQGIHPAEREAVALRTAARELLDASQRKTAAMCGDSDEVYEVTQVAWNAAMDRLHVLVAQEGE